MKTLFTSLLGTLLYLGSYSHASAQAEQPLQDTLTIQIGKDKKVIILVKDQQALKSLEFYDLNKMVRDLNDQADTINQQKTIIITDEDGNRYRIEYDIVGETDRDDMEWEEEDIEVEADEDTTADAESDMEKTVNIIFNGDKKHKHKDYSRTRSSFMIDLGMNNYLQDGKFPQEDNEQYAVRSWGSWYVGLTQTYTTQIAGPLALQWGGGVNWYNFKFEDPNTRLKKTAEEITFEPETSTEIHAEKSKLTVSYITLQAVPMLDFGYNKKKEVKADGSTVVNRWHDSKGFRIGLGGYAGYRLGSYTKYKFELNNDEKKDRDRNSYYLNNWRYGLRMQLGFKGIDLFAQYDLNELFSEDKGPQLNAFSFGISL